MSKRYDFRLSDLCLSDIFFLVSAASCGLKTLDQLYRLSDNLIMENQFANYISLKDASSLCEYSPDYLNLLVRKGKLKSLKIGRNWVTKKEWLEKYLSGHSKSKFDNYISLKEASRFCDHSPDYLNLLVRKGKLKALKIGRNWVTKKDWVEVYLQNTNLKNSELAKEREANVITPAIAISELEKKTEAFEMLPAQIIETVMPMPAPRPFEIARNIELIKKENVNFNRKSKERGNFAEKFAAFPESITLPLLVCTVFVIFFWGVRPVLDQVKYGVGSGLAGGTANLFGAFAGAAKDVGDKFAGIAEYLMNDKSEVTSIITNAVMVEKIVYDESMKSLQDNVVNDTKGRFEKFRQEFGLITKNDGKQERGIVVVPSSGNQEKDRQIESKIEESFSDEVKVRPTNDTTGVIVPKFKDKEGSEYLYMMVPARENINKTE